MNPTSLISLPLLDNVNKTNKPNVLNKSIVLKNYQKNEAVILKYCRIFDDTFKQKLKQIIIDKINNIDIEYNDDIIKSKTQPLIEILHSVITANIIYYFKDYNLIFKLMEMILKNIKQINDTKKGGGIPTLSTSLNATNNIGNIIGDNKSNMLLPPTLSTLPNPLNETNNIGNIIGDNKSNMLLPPALSTSLNPLNATNNIIGNNLNDKKSDNTTNDIREFISNNKDDDAFKKEVNNIITENFKKTFDGIVDKINISDKILNYINTFIDEYFKDYIIDKEKIIKFILSEIIKNDHINNYLVSKYSTYKTILNDYINNDYIITNEKIKEIIHVFHIINFKNPYPDTETLNNDDIVKHVDEPVDKADNDARPPEIVKLKEGGSNKKTKTKKRRNPKKGSNKKTKRRNPKKGGSKDPNEEEIKKQLEIYASKILNKDNIETIKEKVLVNINDTIIKSLKKENIIFYNINLKIIKLINEIFNEKINTSITKINEEILRKLKGDGEKDNHDEQLVNGEENIDGDNKQVVTGENDKSLISGDDKKDEVKGEGENSDIAVVDEVKEENSNGDDIISIFSEFNNEEIFEDFFSILMDNYLEKNKENIKDKIIENMNKDDKYNNLLDYTKKEIIKIIDNNEETKNDLIDFFKQKFIEHPRYPQYGSGEYNKKKRITKKNNKNKQKRITKKRNTRKTI
jgi:hypothetical protein